MTRLLFYVSASSAAGLGHLVRCSSLAEHASRENIECVFVLNEEALRLAQTRQSWRFTPVVLPQGLTPHKHAMWLDSTVQRLAPDVIVLDSYDLTPEMLGPVTCKHHPLVVMDDGQQTLTRFASIVVNPATRSLDLHYRQSNPSVVCATGPDFRILAPEYSQTTLPPVLSREYLTVCFGGSDPLDLTLPALKALQKREASMPIKVVTGPGYGALKPLQAWLSASSLDLRHVHNEQNMYRVWQRSRLAISAAGGSQFELGCCQTPSLLVVIAENQRNATCQAVAEKWCESIDALAQPDSCEWIAERAIALFNRPECLQQMSLKARDHYDCKGAQRLLALIMRTIA